MSSILQSLVRYYNFSWFLKKGLIIWKVYQSAPVWIACILHLLQVVDRIHSSNFPETLQRHLCHQPKSPIDLPMPQWSTTDLNHLVDFPKFRYHSLLNHKFQIDLRLVTGTQIFGGKIFDTQQIFSKSLLSPCHAEFRERLLTKLFWHFPWSTSF